MFCPNCGKEIPDDSSFCEFCGSRIEDDTAADAERYSGQDQGGNAGKLMERFANVPMIFGIVVLAIALLAGGFYIVKTIKSGEGKSDDEPTAVNSLEASGKHDAEEDYEADKTAGEMADLENPGNNAASKESGETGAKSEIAEDILTSGETSGSAETSGSEGQDAYVGSDYTPETYAISGGKWDILQSGEIVYTMADGSSVQNAWIENKGKYLYVDFTGCLMKNNYTADGFWVGDDGAWDMTKPQRTDDVEPISGATYGTDPVIEIDILNYSDGGTYGRAKRSYSFGYVEEYTVMPLGCSAYLLEGKDDFNTGLLMVVSEDQKTLTVSGAGETTEYVISK